jgi:hypothetical protein
MRQQRFLGMAVMLLLLWGCANVVPPTGGDRDVVPPVLLRALPTNGTLFFNKQTHV